MRTYICNILWKLWGESLFKEWVTYSLDIQWYFFLISSEEWMGEEDDEGEDTRDSTGKKIGVKKARKLEMKAERQREREVKANISVHICSSYEMYGLKYEYP